MIIKLKNILKNDVIKIYPVHIKIDPSYHDIFLFYKTITQTPMNPKISPEIYIQLGTSPSNIILKTV